jgi:glycosyltransferase involved in cell wall biosynthesis
MRILMLTDRFPPEIRSAAHLFHELARDLQRRQHEVAVITKAPRQYFANGAGRGTTLGWEDVGGVPTLRVRGFPIPGYHPIVRGLDHLTLGWSFGRASGRWPSADVILVYSPPLPLALAGARYARRFRVPFVLNVQDLYPQTAIDLKLLRNPLAIRLAERMEGLAYHRAARIVVHSPGNRTFLIERKGVPADRVRVIFNWVDTEAIRPGPRENSFRAQHRLAGKFVVSYAGVMGYAQDLSDIIQCAELTRTDEEIVYLLVGEGVLEKRWKEMVAARRLRNVRFLPMQPKAEYTELLAASDVCLVPLDAHLRTPVVPGKLQSIMASGRPAITIVPPEGDTPRLLQESGGGINILPGRPQDLCDELLRLKSRPEVGREMGRRGRRFAEDHFAVTRCAGAYEELFEELLKESGADRMRNPQRRH